MGSPVNDEGRCHPTGEATRTIPESLDIFGRLKPGVTVAQATTNVNLLSSRSFAAFGGGAQRKKGAQGHMFL